MCIVAGEETWVHHYDLENKRQSKKYSQKGSPVPKKFKTKSPAGKDMLTAFWNSDGVFLTDFLETDAIVNSEQYSETIKAFKKMHCEEGGGN